MSSDIKVIIETILQDKGFQSKIKGMQDGLQKTESIASKLGKLFISGLGIGSGIAIFNKLTGFLKNGIKVYADFEQAIANVRSISGGASKELEKLARMAGQNTVFSATESADALYLLASAGLDVKEMAETLEPTLNLAAASQIGIAEATDLVVGQLKVFQKEELSAADATDIMAKTVQSSNTNMQQLGAALQYASSIAATTGISFQDLNVLLASMADLGIKGERAGTQLRQALARLTAPTADVEKALSKYNINLSEVKDLLPTPIKLFQRLRDANIDNEDALKIFGVRQTDIINLMKNGEVFINKNTKAISEFGGAAKKAADIQIDTVQGKMKLLNSAWEEFLLLLTEGAGAPLKEFLSGLRSVVTFLSKFVLKIRLVADNFVYIFDILKEMGGALIKFATTSKKEWNNIAVDTANALKIINKEHAKTMADLIKRLDNYGKTQSDANKKTKDDAEKLAEERVAIIDQLIKKTGTKEEELTELTLEQLKDRLDQIFEKETEFQELKKEMDNAYQEFLNEKDSERIENVQVQHDTLLNMLQYQLDNQLISQTEYNDKVKALEETTTKYIKDQNKNRLKDLETTANNMKKTWDSYKNVVSSVNDAVSIIYKTKLEEQNDADEARKKELKKQLKAIFIANQTLAHLQVGVDTASGIMKAYAAYPYELASVYAVAIGLQGAAQHAVIAAQTWSTKETGGYAKGGISPDDSVAFLQRREMVLPAELADFVRQAAAQQITNNNVTNNENINLGGMNVSRDMTIGEIMEQLEENYENMGVRQYSRMS